MIYLWPDSALLIIDSKRTKMHSHFALELYIGIKSTFEMDFGSGSKSYRYIAVNSRVAHRFSGNHGPYVLILINPINNNFSSILMDILDGRKYLDLSDSDNNPFPSEIPLSCNNALGWIKDLFNNLNNDYKNFMSTRIKDPRIKDSWDFINNSFQEKIKLSSLAERANLSESRFRHLFKQESGVSIRYYILNKRVVEAVKLINKGYSKTEAAHMAGFSDSAHLSRTFKNMYGLTLSSLYKRENSESFNLCKT